MSKYRNCMNCGAPIDTEVNKCPYCGTSYLDICGLKLDGKTPIVLKYEQDYNGHKVIVSALMVAEASPSLTTTYDTVNACGKSGQFLTQFHSAVNAELELHFQLIPDSKNQLMVLTVEE